MNNSVSEPEWSLWRSFAAVVAHGSLSGAARALGASQPTIGRHVDALEQSLGVVLFERAISGFKPTETALRLYEPIGRAQAALAEARLMAEGAQEELSGTVRITASTVIAAYALPNILRAIRHQFPAIAIELLPSDTAENLLLREADIAIRMFRPTQLELIARRLDDIPIMACAHADYLAERGTPQTPADLAQHDLIGMDRSDALIAAGRAMGFAWSRESFALRNDSQTGYWELIKAGLGIGFAQGPLIAKTPGMVALLPDLPVPSLPVWLVTHRELYTSRKIRAIYDALASGLADYIAPARMNEKTT